MSVSEKHKSVFFFFFMFSWEMFTQVWSFSPVGNFWNAASFSSPAAHLHFPSFRGETSTDISFYFKTSSTHGVFLENLGVNDLLHIELRGVCGCVCYRSYASKSINNRILASPAFHQVWKNTKK